MKAVLLTGVFTLAAAAGSADVSQQTLLATNCAAFKVFLGEPDLFVGSVQSYYAGFLAGAHLDRIAETVVLAEFTSACNASPDLSVADAMKIAVTNARGAASQ